MAMRRYSAVIGAALAADIFVYEYVGHMISVAFAAVLPFSVYLLIREVIPENPDHAKATVRFFMIVLSAALLICHIQLYLIDDRESGMAGKEGRYIILEGRVSDVERKTDRTIIQMEVSRMGAEETESERILINCKENRDICISDYVRAGGSIRVPESRRNPNTFDYRRYLRTRRIYREMRADNLYVIKRGTGWKATLYRLKLGYLEELDSVCSREVSDIMAAVLFGDKGGLDEDTLELFRKNGTAHILAVSGLHIGIIYTFLVFVWNMGCRTAPIIFGAGRGWRFFLTIGVFFLGYTFLAGFAPSVVRAVLMVMLHAFASMTGRYYDLKCAALAVGIGVLLNNPLTLFNSGFQMSFLAVFSLSIVLPYVRKTSRLELMPGNLPAGLAAGISIQIGLLPYMIYQFNWFPLLAVFINLPVILLAGWLVPLGVVAMIVQGVGTVSDVRALESLSTFIDRITGTLCELMVYLNDLCCIDGITVIRVASPPVWLVAGAYLAAVAFATEGGRLLLIRRGRKLIAPMITVVLVLSAATGIWIDDGFRHMDLVFVDVGQGDCIHVRVKDGPDLPGNIALGCRTRNYLMDGGGSDNYEVGRKTLKPYLLKNGVRTIDGAFVTHLHTDHYKGICELAREGMVRRLFVYEANRLKLDDICRETGLGPDRIVFLHGGQTLKLNGSGDCIEVLWPPRRPGSVYAEMLKNDKDENASSLLMRVSINGTSLLVTGDMGEEGEKQLMEARNPNRSDRGSGGQLQADILKLGHHGSRYSTSVAFLEEVNPSLAVIQVGKNNTYGHPTPEVLSRLAGLGVPVYRNDLQGAVGFRLKAENVRDHQSRQTHQLGQGKVKEVRTMIR